MTSWNQDEAITAIVTLRSSLDTVLLLLEQELHRKADTPLRDFDKLLKLRHAAQALDVFIVEPTSGQSQRAALASLDDIRNLLDPRLIAAASTLTNEIASFRSKANEGYAAIVAAPDYKNPRKP